MLKRKKFYQNSKNMNQMLALKETAISLTNRISSIPIKELELDSVSELSRKAKDSAKHRIKNRFKVQFQILTISLRN